MSFNKNKFIDVLSRFDKEKHTDNELDEAIQAFTALYCHNVTVIEILRIMGCTAKEWTSYIRKGI